MIKETLYDQFFKWAYVSLLSILCIGIPLIFTPLTRSVFEVNKILFMRTMSLTVAGVWLTQVLLYHYFQTPIKSALPVIKKRGIHWRKMGIEIPLFIWLISSILSTIFSQNIRISFYGSYDRWEGLVTILNYILIVIIYAKLLPTRRAIMIVLLSISAAASLSAIYGLAQSLGYDAIHWSLDPTNRVFACINNPVHFCAYMGMVIPISVSLYFYILEKKHSSFKWLLPVLFVITGFIYYAQYLSYSRATWIGFLIALTLFYLFNLHLFNRNTSQLFLLDILISTVLTGCFYLYFLFRIHLLSPWIASGLYFSLTILLIVLVFINPHRHTFKHHYQNWLFFLILPLLWLHCVYPQISTAFSLGTHLLLAIMITLITIFIQRQDLRFLLQKILIILAFASLQFITISLIHFLCFFTLIICLILSAYSKTSISQKHKVSLLLFMMLFSLILLIPKVVTIYGTFNANTQHSDSFKIVQNSDIKISSYRDVAIQGTARTSMWKSSIPWIKDHWFLGSGLDTIKYMYPIYRRPEYGILEGGHNFTPDRLHNEYLNTLASKGIIGFISYYFIFLGGWFVLLLKGIHSYHNQELKYLTFGCCLGATVYLFQVLFNFGVVATLFLFYAYIGIGIALHYLGTRFTHEKN